MIDRIIAILISLQAPNADVIGDAIHAASRGDSRIASLLIMTGYRESRFLDRIQAGECKRYECDSFIAPDGTLRFRSRSYWQLQRTASISLEEWQSTTGLNSENISTAAMVSARLFSRGLKACGTLEGAIAVYARGAGCQWVGAKRRADMARRIQVKLQ